ncbi:hypothetical protein O6H91_06G052600 [Diphasiastrum complanatum]|uniref:Uncharacterized protein n=1 Tax=Diphasiastrum complanatum TaxID=34168 RepID=A0ACC2DDL6_DIPCM|nr:hypothetical protein O6H91_06G052600 [Diphasiastrum complanatum]
MYADYVLRTKDTMGVASCRLSISCSRFVFFYTSLALLLFSVVVSAQSEPSYMDIDAVLSTTAIPTIGADGKIYVCAGTNLLVYNSDGTMAWRAAIKMGSCERRVAPVIDPLGKVYVAAQQKVIVITPSNNKTSSVSVTMQELYSLTTNSTEDAVIYSTITGLSLSSGGGVLYINFKQAGLYAVGVDGTPLWAIGGNITSSWMQSQLDPSSFCEGNLTFCYFHFSPAVDLCDGTLYIVNANGWLYAINAWQPFLRWRYNLNLTGSMTEAGVTAGNNGRVYVAIVEPGNVYAFDARFGSLLWKSEIGPLSVMTCFPRVDISGWVFLGSLDGYLYAISTDGTQTKKYLSTKATNSVIQTCPYLGCSGDALFVAQVEVVSKLATISNGLPVVSYASAIDVIISLLNPFTGSLIWSTNYPGKSYTTDNTISYNLDSSLLLALIAQNISSKGACTRSERNLIASCLMSYDYPQLQGFRTKQFLALYITLPLLFCLIFGASILAYVFWSRRQKVLRICLRNQRRRGQGMPIDEETILKKKANMEEALSTVTAMLQKDPASKDLQDRLNLIMQSLKFVEELLSLYYNGVSNANADSFNEKERLLSYTVPKTEDEVSEPIHRISMPLDLKNLNSTSDVMVNPLFRPLEVTSPKLLQQQPQKLSREMLFSEYIPAEMSSKYPTDLEASPNLSSDEEQQDSESAEGNPANYKKSIQSSSESDNRDLGSLSALFHPPSPSTASFAGDANLLKEAETPHSLESLTSVQELPTTELHKFSLSK